MNQPKYSRKEVFDGTFEDAVTRITQTLQNEGFGILAQIDVKETLKKKLNLDYSHYVILGACNPPNAYKALEAEKEIGLLLPCNVIVYEESDKVYIGILKPTVALVSDNSIVKNIAKEVEVKLTNALEQAVNKGGEK